MLIDKYSLVVFDLDGTLVHTVAKYRYQIVPHVLKKLGVNTATESLIDKFWFDGNRNETIKNDFGLDKDIFWKVFHKEDSIEKRIQYTHVYNDVHEAIYKLKSHGKKLAITTGAPKKIAKIETDLIPKEEFSKIISITSTRYKAKPHPESLIGCLKYCKIKPRDSVYIGNSREDGEYAKAAGVDFIYLERREHNFAGEAVSTISNLLDLI